ncbi:MAG: hypothetical protein HC801_04220 [Nitrospira sp.]|nr:hypothetical protein [Nitrospira sp.]
MLAWSRPDPLTRDLIHLINARRHDHGDTDDAIDTLQAFLEQGREHDLLTVLAALDEEMAEWLFDLVAEASCTLLLDGSNDEKPTYATIAALELPLQANLTSPLKLKIDPIATADLLHRNLQLPVGTVVRVESRLLTDATLEMLNLQMFHDHLMTVADSRRAQSVAARLLPPVENTAFLLFELMGRQTQGCPTHGKTISAGKFSTAWLSNVRSWHARRIRSRHRCMRLTPCSTHRMRYGCITWPMKPLPCGESWIRW